MKSSIIWYNGDFQKADEIRISPFDSGLLTGDGIFETLIAYRGVPFAAHQHYLRLHKGAETLGITIPSERVIEDAMHEVIQQNDLANETQTRLRVTVTAGNCGRETWIITATSLPEFKATAGICTLPYSRNEKSALTGIKSTSYAENSLSLRQVKAKGMDEGIFGNTEGNLCEGTCTNIFVIQEDGKLVTPPLSDGCLPGITRELVLKIADEGEILIEETSIPFVDLAKTKTAFLTSSLRGIQPIHAIDGRKLDSDDRIDQLQKSYQAKTKK